MDHFDEISAKAVSLSTDLFHRRFGEISKALEQRIQDLTPEEFGVDVHRSGSFVSEYGLNAYRTLKDPSEFFDLVRACRDLLPQVLASTATLRKAIIDDVVDRVSRSNITTAAVRNELSKHSSDRVIIFSQIPPEFSNIVKRTYPRYTTIFVYYYHLLERSFFPIFRALVWSVLPRAISVTLNTDLADLESEADEQEHMLSMGLAEQVAKKVLADSSFNETGGVLGCIDVDGQITTEPLEVTQSSTDQARRLVTRAFAQLDIENRRLRLTNISRPLVQIIDELHGYFEQDATGNAVLIWQTNIQFTAIVNASQMDAKTASSELNNENSDYSIPDIPRDVVIALQQLSAALGMFVLTFESVQKMLEYYDLHNRMQQLSQQQVRFMFDQFLVAAMKNAEIFSDKLTTLLADLIEAQKRFSLEKMPKGLLSTIVAVVRGILQSMGRVILRKSTAAIGGIIIGITGNAASQGLEDGPLYQSIVTFFQNGRHLLILLADKLPEYFGYIRSLLDLI